MLKKSVLTRHVLGVEVEYGEGKTYNRVESWDLVRGLIRRELSGVRPALAMSTIVHQNSSKRRAPTLLDELESLFDVALVSYEQEAAWQMSLLRGSFDCGNLRSECNTGPNDTMGWKSIWPELV